MNEFWTLVAWLTAGMQAASSPSLDLPAQLGEVALDRRAPYFTLDSSVSVGSRGEETIDVSVAAACGEPVWVFHRAELFVKRNRFGDVQFVGLPMPGCVTCEPVRLRWFHEPTGFLSFEVHVYRRLELIACTSEAS
jgi:hypothetical protein